MWWNQNGLKKKKTFPGKMEVDKQKNETEMSEEKCETKVQWWNGEKKYLFWGKEIKWMTKKKRKRN